MPEVAQEKSREKHRRFRCDRYSKMLERQRILRECEAESSLARAEAILRAEKEYLLKHGVRVNWPGKKALEEAYKQAVSSTSTSDLPSSSSSTSISYSSNIQGDIKSFSFGGSLPSSPHPVHVPLHKTSAVLPQSQEPPSMTRLSLASASPIRGNPTTAVDSSFNLSDVGNSSLFAQNAPLTSTPIGGVKPQSLFFIHKTTTNSSG